ncbi:MAG: TetR family transcriptional regulator [Frankiales bacterium]|nr:TetR family transcriptional regulator [Frankiales bacterium]
MSAESTEGRPWRGLSPQERRDARRRRLLDAALELFGTKGYAATSLTALCAAGGVSPRHFYELYPGREQLIADLYDELCEHMRVLIAEAQGAAPLTAVDRVVSGLRVAIDFQTADPRRARVLQLEVVGVSSWLEAHRHDVIASFGRGTDEQYRLLVADGQVVDEPFEQVAIALVGALNELVIGWLLAEPRPPRETLVPIAEEVFVTVFQGREVARR